MKENQTKQTRIVCEHDPFTFEQQCNAVGAELADMKDVTKTSSSYTEEGKHYFVAEYDFTEVKDEPEGIDEVFGMNGAGCKCSDCPFLEVGTDARRKWFPCAYAEYGEAHIDAPACEVFYREAIRMMRERCRNANKEEA